MLVLNTEKSLSISHKQTQSFSSKNHTEQEVDPVLKFYSLISINAT